MEAADAISPASRENIGVGSIKNIFCFVVIDPVTDEPMGVFETEDRACLAAEAYTNQEGVGCQVLEVRKERLDLCFKRHVFCTWGDCSICQPH